MKELAALIAANSGRAGLYGYSSGCLVALRAAAAGLPVDRLALVEPPTEPAPDARLLRAGSTPSPVLDSAGSDDGLTGMAATVAELHCTPRTAACPASGTAFRRPRRLR